MGLKMKGEALDELVKRLRSGEYVQGQGALRRHADEDETVDTYCCLGVMCEMAVEAGIVHLVETDIPGHSFGYQAPNGAEAHTAYLPAAVIEWAGLVSDLRKYPDLGDYHYEERGQFSELEDLSLAQMNDSGKPFPEIANWLVANVERV